VVLWVGGKEVEEFEGVEELEGVAEVEGVEEGAKQFTAHRGILVCGETSLYVIGRFMLTDRYDAKSTSKKCDAP